jgi:uncharacterized protein YecT (DUF1311 family)
MSKLLRPLLQLALTATVAGTALWPSGGAAQGARRDCANATTTPEIAACAADDLAEADAELNATYRRALESIKAANHLNTNQRRGWERALREAQRHWLAFRDKDCGEVIGWEWFGGTGMGTASLACKAAKTRARTDEIKARYAGG